jgi:DNA-binding SARP family transcriptional activator
MSMLQISILGKPAVSFAGHEVAVPGGRASALLYRLAAQSESVPREHLGFLFWPTQPEDGMRRNLTRLCNQLQRALPVGNALIMDDEGVSLNMSLVWSDAVLFLQLARDYNRTPRMVLLCALLDLYRGPFLDEFSLLGSVEHKLWVNLARRHWERDHLTALRTLVEQSMRLGDFQQAISVARRYLAVDPADESMHRHLIELYGLSGDSVAVQRQYEACAALLLRERGRTPDETTDVVRRSALAGDLDHKQIVLPFEPHLEFADREQGRRQWQYESKPRRQKILPF